MDRSDPAQMAFALGRKVVVHMDDTKKHNGWCFASRIDVLRGSATEEPASMTHDEASADALE